MSANDCALWQYNGVNNMANIIILAVIAQWLAMSEKEKPSQKRGQQ